MIEEYDFLVVGGGTAGLVVAARLSEDPDVQVLVIEAGTNHIEDPRVKIPALYQALKDTEVDWSFRTEAQATLNGRQISISQGRALGGSSAMNAHVFVPPSKTVIDAWEKLGNPGWNWKNLRPYYAKAYSVKAPQAELNEALGLDWINRADALTSGPIQTSYADNLGDAVSKAWIDTFKTLGYNMTEDPFSGKPMGAFSCLASIDPVAKERSYAATAYYAPAKDRQNLHMLTESTVEKLLFEHKGSKLCATGVQFQQHGITETASARKEVILAAGSFQSPKLLELSGIGAKGVLQSHGINVRIDSPYVGENLQDHIVCSIGFEAKDHIQTSDDLVRQDPKAIESAMGEYLAGKTGPFTSLGVSPYAYLPIIELIPREGQQMLNRLLDKTSGNHSPSDPSPGLYNDIARSILESKDEGSGSFSSQLNRVPTKARSGKLHHSRYDAGTTAFERKRAYRIS